MTLCNSGLRFDQLVGDEADDACIGDSAVWPFGSRKRLRDVFWPMAVLKQDRDENAGVLNLKFQSGARFETGRVEDFAGRPFSFGS